MVLETGLRGSVSGRIVSCGRDGSQVAQHVAELVGSSPFCVGRAITTLRIHINSHKLDTAVRGRGPL